MTSGSVRIIFVLVRNVEYIAEVGLQYKCESVLYCIEQFLVAGYIGIFLDVLIDVGGRKGITGHFVLHWDYNFSVNLDLWMILRLSWSFINPNYF